MIAMFRVQIFGVTRQLLSLVGGGALDIHLVFGLEACYHCEYCQYYCYHHHHHL